MTWYCHVGNLSSYSVVRRPPAFCVSRRVTIVPRSYNSLPIPHRGRVVHACTRERGTTWHAAAIDDFPNSACGEQVLELELCNFLIRYEFSGNFCTAVSFAKIIQSWNRSFGGGRGNSRPRIPFRIQSALSWFRHWLELKLRDHFLRIAINRIIRLVGLWTINWGPGVISLELKVKLVEIEVAFRDCH